MPALNRQTATKETAKTHSFTIYLGGIKSLTNRVVDRLYEAGCDDATVAFQNGELSIDYDRKAASLDRALAGAVRQLIEHGFRVRRIEILKVH